MGSEMCIRDRLNSDLIEGFENGQTLGIRAEKVEIAPEGKGRLSCRVSEAEFLGNETLIGLDHDGISGLTVLRPGLALIPTGERIEVTFNDQDLHVFDQAGNRVSEQ